MRAVEAAVAVEGVGVVVGVEAVEVLVVVVGAEAVVVVVVGVGEATQGKGETAVSR